jgi:Flp pilus assembly protein TadG
VVVTAVQRRLRSRDERGAAAVEFAIILPVLVLIVFGIVQFSIQYNRQQGLHAAAREGARLASLPQTTQDDINDRVLDALDGISFDTTPTVSVSPSATQPCDQRSGETTVVVTVQTTSDLDIPLWGSQTLDLTGRGEFRCE